MVLPIAKLGVSGSVNLKFEDEDDLKEHPMIGDKVGMKASDVLAMVGIDKDSVSGYSTDLSGIDEAKLAENPQAKMMVLGLKAGNRFGDFLGQIEVDGKFNMETDVVVANFFHSNVHLQTEGVGPVA